MENITELNKTLGDKLYNHIVQGYPTKTGIYKKTTEKVATAEVDENFLTPDEIRSEVGDSEANDKFSTASEGDEDEENTTNDGVSAINVEMGFCTNPFKMATKNIFNCKKIVNENDLDITELLKLNDQQIEKNSSEPDELKTESMETLVGDEISFDNNEMIIQDIIKGTTAKIATKVIDEIPVVIQDDLKLGTIMTAEVEGLKVEPIEEEKKDDSPLKPTVPAILAEHAESKLAFEKAFQTIAKVTESWNKKPINPNGLQGLDGCLVHIAKCKEALRNNNKQFIADTFGERDSEVD